MPRETILLCQHAHSTENVSIHQLYYGEASALIGIIIIMSAEVKTEEPLFPSEAYQTDCVADALRQLPAELTRGRWCGCGEGGCGSAKEYDAMTLDERKARGDTVGPLLVHRPIEKAPLTTEKMVEVVRDHLSKPCDCTGCALKVRSRPITEEEKHAHFSAMAPALHRHCVALALQQLPLAVRGERWCGCGKGGCASTAHYDALPLKEKIARGTNAPINIISAPGEPVPTPEVAVAFLRNELCPKAPQQLTPMTAPGPVQQPLGQMRFDVGGDGIMDIKLPSDFAQSMFVEE